MKKVFIKRDLPPIIFPEMSEETGTFNRGLIFKNESPSKRREQHIVSNPVLMENYDETLNKEIKIILQINGSSYEK